jgi:hypothetical protein
MRSFQQRTVCDSKAYGDYVMVEAGTRYCPLEPFAAKK